MLPKDRKWKIIDITATGTEKVIHVLAASLDQGQITEVVLNTTDKYLVE